MLRIMKGLDFDPDKNQFSGACGDHSNSNTAMDIFEVASSCSSFLSPPWRIYYCRAAYTAYKHPRCVQKNSKRIMPER